METPGGNGEREYALNRWYVACPCGKACRSWNRIDSSETRSSIQIIGRHYQLLFVSSFDRSEKDATSPDDRTRLTISRQVGAPRDIPPIGPFQWQSSRGRVTVARAAKAGPRLWNGRRRAEERYAKNQYKRVRALCLTISPFEISVSDL
jgi:hypothetical protein